MRTQAFANAASRAAILNREAALIILTDPAKHGGEESLAVRWARLFMRREATVERAA